MRAYSWILVSSVALACSGGAFTANPEGSSGGDGSGDAAGEGASAGVVGLAGRGVGGSLIGSGGKVAVGGTTSFSGSDTGGGDTGGSTMTGGNTMTGGVVGSGGVVGVAGDVSIGGDLVSGGSMSVAGQVGMGGSSGGGNPGDTSCPATQPTAGGACKGPLTCSYGTDVRPNCRAVASCHNNVWQLGAVLCKPLAQCGPDMVPGAVCDPQVAPSSCSHDSVYCLCAACIGNSCAPQATWHCSVNSGDASCPKVAPNEGQACDASLKCQYGSCALPQAGNIEAVCDKTWSWTAQFCPT